MPPIQPTSIRLPRALRRWLDADARAEQRPFSTHVVYILTKWKEFREGQKK